MAADAADDAYGVEASAACQGVAVADNQVADGTAVAAC